jgi:hypothetical protein
MRSNGHKIFGRYQGAVVTFLAKVFMRGRSQARLKFADEGARRHADGVLSRELEGFVRLVK